MADPEEDDEQESAGVSLSPEVIRSYLTFVKRAIRSRWYVSVLVLVVGLGITAGLKKFLPRTYVCKTVLMPVGNPVLDGRDVAQPFVGAADLIMRHENLENLIKELDLLKKQQERRTPLLKLKDKLLSHAGSEPPLDVQIASMVGTLETRIEISAERGDLSITVEWTDGVTAAEVAAAARDSFLKQRRSAEVAAFDEKMEILDEHSKKLREEINKLAAQVKAARADQAKQEREARAALRASAQSAAAAAAPLRVAIPRAPRASASTNEPDPNLAQLREKLAASQRKLAELQSERERKLREEQTKYDEMKLKLTPSHPQVITQGERVAMFQQISSDEALLQAEVQDTSAEIRQGEAMAKAAAGGAAPPPPSSVLIARAGGGAGPADLLPPEITDLLQRNDLDPTLSAQLSGEVMKWGALRDEILSARIQLDTAQAAFARRYQVIIPADIPYRASKPKPPVILGGGAAVSILLALLLPILAQLRRGVMIEIWQVHQLNLPVLAELKLPPHSGE